MNTSILNDNKTARTNSESASQRAEHLYLFGCSNVLELCVGPSLNVLADAYNKYGVRCTGNDIEKRWQDYYPQGKWIIGNAFDIDYSHYDAIVFAPPVTQGCTGKRVDSLSVNDVNPHYIDFINKVKQYPSHILKVMVLPARSLATNRDRKQLYELLSHLTNYEIIPLTEGKRHIRKYVDVYFY